MSIYGNISMLGSAMRSFQYGMDVASNNIANATTLGYSRQVLNLEPGMPVNDGNFWLGSGANASSVSRIRNLFLDSRIKFELSELGRASVRQTALTELAAIFPEVATGSAAVGLTGAINNVASAWTVLAVSPASIGAKTAVRDALKALADMLQIDARAVYNLQVKLDAEVQSTVTEINRLSDQIASLNTQIRLTSGQGNPPGALLDIREQAAEKLAKLINANFTVLGDGNMVVTFNGGVLADGTQAKHLVQISSPYDPGRTAIGYYQTPFGSPTNVTAQITGGELGGLLAVRDGEVEKARLDLNRIAFGIISRSNEINRCAVAADTTSNHALFVGTTAADIALDPNVTATPDYVGATRDAAVPGDLARMQSQIQRFIQYSSIRTATSSTLSGGGPNIDPNATLASQIFFAAPSPGGGQLVISGTGNAIAPINWLPTDTLNDIIAQINTAGAGAIYATFDANSQKMIIVGDTPLTVYDLSGNLADTLMLSSVVTSSAPINNYPVPGAAATMQIFTGIGMNTGQNILDLFTTPSTTGGTILIDGVPVNWTPADDIGGTLFVAVQLAIAPPAQVFLFFDSATQTARLERSGDPAGANAGSHAFPGASMNSVQVVDQTGNLSRTLNLDTNTNGSKILDELVVALGSRKDAETVLEAQAQALVDQSQQLQDNVSKVDVNSELAQARLYQRSFEASVRLQGILDEMLNVLINHTGTQSSAGTSV
jgi:flagellar hook-associated protein 1 FlgK